MYINLYSIYIYNQEQSQWKHICEPTDCCLTISVIVPFMCALYLTLLSLLYCVCSLMAFFFWMGLKSSWHQRQCTVILDRAKYWHYKKTGYRPSQYLVIQGKNFLFVLQLHWGWNWRKRRFKSSGFTEFCWVGSATGCFSLLCDAGSRVWLINALSVVVFAFSRDRGSTGSAPFIPLHYFLYTHVQYLQFYRKEAPWGGASYSSGLTERACSEQSVGWCVFGREGLMVHAEDVEKGTDCWAAECVVWVLWAVVTWSQDDDDAEGDEGSQCHSILHTAQWTNQSTAATQQGSRCQRL